MAFLKITSRNQAVFIRIHRNQTKETDYVY